MKKIVSLLIILLFFAIGWMNTTMASFVVDINSGMNMQMDDESNDIKSCETIDHSCCVSPFKESSSIQNSNIQINDENNFKIKILDYNFLALLNDKLKINYLDKLSSPPEIAFYSTKSNTYTNLVGIIKNNC